jgi:hypothetical protein
MTVWTKASQEEAQRARTNGKPVRFTSDGWFIGVDLAEEAKGDLTKEAEATFRPIIVKDGQYVTNYQECVCGEQYLVEEDHERTSRRHKEWADGRIEVPVPPQPLASAYPVGIPTPKLVLGMNKVCERCKAKDRKGESYYPDPDSRAKNRYPCKRCNGHGVRPNAGP